MIAPVINSNCGNLSSLLIVLGSLYVYLWCSVLVSMFGEAVDQHPYDVLRCNHNPISCCKKCVCVVKGACVLFVHRNGGTVKVSSVRWSYSLVTVLVCMLYVVCVYVYMQ